MGSGSTSARVVPYHRDENSTLYHGDCLSVLRSLPAGSVHTCVTSPPYWRLRDNGEDRQLGLEDSPLEYAGKLVEVFREVRRVLDDRGTVWLNVGDVYNNVGHVPPRSGWQRRKQLTLVPFRVAIGLQDDGWWVRNVCVWHKPNAIPASVTDRLSNRWEPVFLLAKSEDYFFNLDALRVRAKTDDAAERQRAGRGNGKAVGMKELRRWSGSPRHRATIDGVKTVRVRPDAPDPREVAQYLREAKAKTSLSFDQMAATLGVGRWQVIHYFRLDGSGSRLPPLDVWLKLKAMLNLDDRYDRAMEYVEKDNVFRNHPNGRNPGDVLTVPVQPFAEAHFSTMPLYLAYLMLGGSLPPGGVALDPFNGAATTGVAARLHGGKYVGIDVNIDYLDISVGRLSGFEAEREAVAKKREFFTAEPVADAESERNGATNLFSELG